MWQKFVLATAIAVLVLGVVYMAMAIRKPNGSAARRYLMFAGVGAFLAGGSRFLPDVFELRFFMLMGGVAALWYASSQAPRSES